MTKESFDTKLEQLVPDGESFNSTANSNNLSSENNPNFVTLTLDMFESDDNTEHIKEVVKKPIPNYVIEKTNRIRAAYRKAAGLDEDCEITENMISTFKLEQMCAENGWNFENARKSLLRKDI